MLLRCNVQILKGYFARARHMLHVCRLVQLTAVSNNHLESLEAEREICKQHRAAIAELAEDALAAKVGTLCHLKCMAQQHVCLVHGLKVCVTAAELALMPHVTGKRLTL